MSNDKDLVRTAGLTADLYELDKEVARLAMLCRVKILEPGVLDRILKKDASVCGTSNPKAFQKLRDMLMMHYAVRDKVVDEFGEAGTAKIMEKVVERLRKNFGDVL
jgi:hypothetical protein